VIRSLYAIVSYASYEAFSYYYYWPVHVKACLWRSAGPATVTPGPKDRDEDQDEKHEDEDRDKKHRDEGLDENRKLPN